jgi:hypothetical protein
MGLMNNGNLLVSQVHSKDLRSRMKLKIQRVTHSKSGMQIIILQHPTSSQVTHPKKLLKKKL